MRSRLLMRFWVEALLGLASAALLALSLLAPDWMEALLGSGPDSGDGSAEWAFALGWAAACVLTLESAGRTWRRRVELLRVT